jgi:hypothetical protein
MRCVAVECVKTAVNGQRRRNVEIWRFRAIEEATWCEERRGQSSGDSVKTSLDLRLKAMYREVA